jgi:hypothetical protein
VALSPGASPIQGEAAQRRPSEVSIVCELGELNGDARGRLAEPCKLCGIVSAKGDFSCGARWRTISRSADRVNPACTVPR